MWAVARLENSSGGRHAGTAWFVEQREMLRSFGDKQSDQDNYGVFWRHGMPAITCGTPFVLLCELATNSGIHRPVSDSFRFVTLSRFQNNSRGVRKSIAQVMTVISQTQRDQLRMYYKGKKYVPLDLRPKKTRAIRRRLTAFESSRKTARETKRETHFPKRKVSI